MTWWWMVGIYCPWPATATDFNAQTGKASCTLPKCSFTWCWRVTWQISLASLRPPCRLHWHRFLLTWSTNHLHHFHGFSRWIAKPTVFLPLSMCTVWITINFTQPLDRSPPHCRDPPTIDRQVKSIDLHVIRQESRFLLSRLTNALHHL